MSAVAPVPVRLEESPFYVELEDEHRAWLSPFHPTHLTNFNRLRNGDYEAAMAEAGVRRLLQSHDVSVEPSADLTDKPAPDFLCEKDGQKFYVEVTNLSIQAVTKETGLPHVSESGARGYGPLDRLLWQACQRKVRQCVGLDHPALIAVGTFHGWASAICLSEPHLDMLLTGQTSISWNVNTETGDSDGEIYETTEVQLAAFLKPDQNEGVGFARSPVSGLLVCSGCNSPFSVLGLLHPNPDNRFDAALLPDVAFGEVIVDGSAGRLSTRWSGSREGAEFEE